MLTFLFYSNYFYIYAHTLCFSNRAFSILEYQTFSNSIMEIHYIIIFYILHITLYELHYIIYLNLYFHFFALVSRLSAALSSATQHAMPPEFSKKGGTKCLNTRFPLPTRLCAGYSVKLI